MFGAPAAYIPVSPEELRKLARFLGYPDTVDVEVVTYADAWQVRVRRGQVSISKPISDCKIATLAGVLRGFLVDEPWLAD